VEGKGGDFTRSRNDSRAESLTVTGSNVKCRARVSALPDRRPNGWNNIGPR
jgi:hypothetical protein